MADLQVTFSSEERAYLQSLLNEILKEKLVEEHRTRKPSFRATVVQEEDTIQAILKKLEKGA